MTKKDEDRDLADSGKTEIIPLSDSLEKILKFQCAKYRIKSNGKEEIGILSGEVLEHFPEGVIDVFGDDVVVYSRIITLLIGAFQDLEKSNGELRSKVERMEKRL
jgi:hypothetical protein